MTYDFSSLSIDQRIVGLSRSQLFSLKDRCDKAVKEIEEGGKIDMWVVSDDSMNLHWDASYARACHYLMEELQKAKGFVCKSTYELRKQKIFANELSSYEESYGGDWKKIQAKLDANTKEQS